MPALELSLNLAIYFEIMLHAVVYNRKDCWKYFSHINTWTKRLTVIFSKKTNVLWTSGALISKRNICNFFFRKQKLLTREDLELPWKPVYQLVENVAYSPYEHHGLQLFPQLVDVFIFTLVGSIFTNIKYTADMIILHKFTVIYCSDS